MLHLLVILLDTKAQMGFAYTREKINNQIGVLHD